MSTSDNRVFTVAVGGSVPSQFTCQLLSGSLGINSIRVRNNSSLTIGLAYGAYGPTTAFQDVIAAGEQTVLNTNGTKSISVNFIGSNTVAGLISFEWTDENLTAQSSLISTISGSVGVQYPVGATPFEYAEGTNLTGTNFNADLLSLGTLNAGQCIYITYVGWGGNYQHLVFSIFVFDNNGTTRLVEVDCAGEEKASIPLTPPLKSFASSGGVGYANVSVEAGWTSETVIGYQGTAFRICGYIL